VANGSPRENDSLKVNAPPREDVERSEISLESGIPVRVDVVATTDEGVVELAVPLLLNEEDVSMPVEHAPGAVDVS
jgi:hypothetical protein